jgi:hypothetical protein
MHYILNLKYGLGSNSAVPHVIARSEIFSSQIYRGSVERPKAIVPLKIDTLGGATIIQTSGHRLDQSDADVFYELVCAFFTRAHNNEDNLQILIEHRDLLARVGRSKGGKTNALLRNSLERLVDARFDILEADGNHYSIGILKNVTYPAEGSFKKEIKIKFDARLIELYLGNQWAILKKKERSVLKSPIAKALYAYYKTHNNKPFPLLPTTIRRLVGRSETKNAKWLTQLRIALDELKNSTGWQVCELVKSGDRTGKVVVVKRAGAHQPPRENRPIIPQEVLTEIYDI